MNSSGQVIVLSGFSGVGKGTIVKELVKKDNFCLSISATTRAMRQEDVDGVTYFFKTKEEFRAMIDNGEFIEWAEFCGNYYGTPKKQIDSILSSGRNVILEIEVEGAKNIKRIYGDNALMIYVLPPTAKDLVDRLVSRCNEQNDNAEGLIEKRLLKALEEVEEVKLYDYIVVNDTVEDAMKKIEQIVDTNNSKYNRNIDFVEKLKGEMNNEIHN